MAKKNFSNKLHDAVENYYHYNPDTLMPLMMVALATNGKLKIAAGTSIPENAACVFARLYEFASCQCPAIPQPLPGL